MWNNDFSLNLMQKWSVLRLLWKINIRLFLFFPPCVNHGATALIVVFLIKQQIPHVPHYHAPGPPHRQTNKFKTCILWDLGYSFFSECSFKIKVFVIHSVLLYLSCWWISSIFAIVASATFGIRYISKSILKAQLEPSIYTLMIQLHVSNYSDHDF